MDRCLRGVDILWMVPDPVLAGTSSHGEPYLPLGILVLWAGFLASMVFNQPVFTMPITSMIGVSVMGFSILNRQVF